MYKILVSEKERPLLPQVLEWPPEVLSSIPVKLEQVLEAGTTTATEVVNKPSLAALHQLADLLMWIAFTYWSNWVLVSWVELHDFVLLFKLIAILLELLIVKSAF